MGYAASQTGGSYESSVALYLISIRNLADQGNKYGAVCEIRVKAANFAANKKQNLNENKITRTWVVSLKKC